MKIPLLLSVLLTAAALGAQTPAAAPPPLSSASLTTAIDTLARGGPLALPGYAGNAQAAPAQLFAHGGLCLVAAQRAREEGNPARTAALLNEAKTALQSARVALSGAPTVLRSQIAYDLGQIAENSDHDLAAAETYYAEAAQLQPQNRDAAQALARVKAYLAFRQSLHG